MNIPGRALSIFVTIVLAASCGRDRNVIVVDSFPIEKAVFCDSTGNVEILDNYVRIAVSNDYLFLQGIKADLIFQQYALPEVKWIKSFGRKGRGPGEYGTNTDIFISPTTELLYIYRPDTSTFYSYRISEEGDLALEREFKVESGILYNQFHIIGDSLLVYNKVPGLGIGRVNLITGEKIGDLQFPVRSGYSESDFFHPDKGVLAANGKYVVYAYHFLKQIDIYNVDDLTLKVRLIGKEHKEPVNIGPDSDMYYYNVYCTDRYIYAYYAKRDTNGGYENYVEVYDYEGNPVARYEMPIATGGVFAVTPNDSTLYGYSHLHEDKILKFDLR